MAPNVIGAEIEQVPLAKEKQRLEIFRDGFFYDVTNFVDRHPGGTVIRFYTESGEDATQAIEQFHYRSRGRVDAIMKSFNRRPALLSERGLDQEALSRHEALSADFKKLFQQLETEGYFKPSIRHTTLRMLEGISLCYIVFGITINFCHTIPTKFIASLISGFAYTRFGWLMHEGGHNSLTGYPKVDKFLQQIGNCYFLGGSAAWWNSQHNRHHAMPQRLHHDVDLATLPVVAFHKRTVKDKKDIIPFFVKYQAFLYWTLSIFLGVMLWKFYLHPQYQLRKKQYFEMLLNLHTYVLIWHIGPVWFFLAAYWFGFFLGLNFSLSHSHLDVTDAPTHWVEYALTHSANITSSPLVDYWMGYLNYQIEHHLFPTMPQFRQKEIGSRVKALAEKHGLPYTVYSYPEACRLSMTNLHKVSKELGQEGLYSKHKDKP